MLHICRLSLTLITFSIVLSFSIPTFAKKLEIIIGGGNYCTADKDCATNTHCHNETHICIECSAPFIWTGTECVCPDNQHKKENTCVQCLIDEHCLDKENAPFCNTQTNTCFKCPETFIREGNECKCPTSTHLVGERCVCDNENKELDADLNCSKCNLNEEKCLEKGSYLKNDSSCECCPLNTPYWSKDENMCITCPAATPIWNATTKRCEVCPAATPIWNATTKKCEPCPTATPIWNATTKKCEACPMSKPIWNATKKVCEPCPSSAPIWNAYQKQCLPVTCKNLGFEYEGLVITSRNAGCGSERSKPVGLHTSGFSIYCDRDHPGPSSITAAGYMYVPNDGSYKFWAHGGQNKYGDARSVLIKLNGETWYSAKNGKPKGNFLADLKKGLYKVNYDGTVYKRTSVGFKQETGNALFCNHGLSNPFCSDSNSYIDEKDGSCKCKNNTYKSSTRACISCTGPNYFLSKDNICYECSEKQNTTAKNEAECHKCGAFTWMDNKCQACPVGYYCPVNKTKIACAAGTYNKETQQTKKESCKTCSKGYYCPTGSSSQTACPKGYYCPTPAEKNICPAGTYNNATKQTQKTDCKTCPAGSYCPTTGLEKQIACPAGSYCPEGAKTPIKCPAGSYCPASSKEPKSCKSGYYCPAGSSSQTACPKGHYCPKPTEKKACPAGTYNDKTKKTKQSDCKTCPTTSSCPAGSVKK